MAVKWIFFDIGDTLFDENAQHQYYFHSLLLALRRNGVEVAWDDYLDRIHEQVRHQPTTAIVDAARSYVQDDTLWDKVFHEGRSEYDQMRRPRPYGMLIDHLEPVLRDLRRDFQLGIIANQHPPVVDAVNDYGLKPLFDVIAIDEIVGVSKPDPALFRWALERAACEPSEAIMVGDRPDHDIAPAHALGIGTVRFQRGILYTHYDPRSDAEVAEIVARDVVELEPAVRRLAEMRRA